MEWIPTSVRMPSEQGQYLVTFPLCNGEPWVYILSFNKGKFYETDDEWGDVEYDDVTAWMPLPYPYTADRKTENSSEKPNNCEDLQDWKDRMWSEAIVTEPQTDRMTEEEIDTMLAKVLVGQTDCAWGETND